MLAFVFVRETITLVVKYGFIGAVYGFAVLLELEKKADFIKTFNFCT